MIDVDVQPLADMIRGKSLAVVGNSPELILQGHGPAIESADLVLRMNNGLPGSSMREGLGHRTDIWATARFDDPSHITRHDPKLIVWFKHTKFGMKQLLRLLKDLKRRHPSPALMIYPLTLEEQLHRWFDPFHASTGLRVMHLLAGYTQPASIEVYGIPFWTEQGSTDAHWYAPDTRSVTHDPKSEHAFAKTLGYTSLGAGRWQWQPTP